MGEVTNEQVNLMLRLFEERRETRLREAREWCWTHEHKWWDEDNRRWHTDRDWDDHDHDRR